MNLDCYAQADRRLMLGSQKTRGAFLEPLLALLSRIGVRPFQVTGCSFLAGLSFGPLLLSGHPLAAVFALAFHVALDGLDGPLARFQQAESPRGAFADTVSDQLIVATTILALLLAGHAAVLPGVLFLLAYTLVVGFAVARNLLRVPYTWLVRPRFAVYTWIAVELSLFPGTLNAVLWFFTVFLCWKVATGFVRIYLALQTDYHPPDGKTAGGSL